MGEIVRLTCEVGHADTLSDDGSWHATVTTDCVRTACGHALDDDRTYDFESKQVKRGGITCWHCMNAIKEYKAIKF